MTQASGPREQWLQFGDLSGPVRFSGCPELVAGIRAILPGWPIREVAPSSRTRPAMRVKRTRRGYRRVSPRLCTPGRSRAKVRAHVVEAICGFHFEFIDWYLEEHPELLFVHGAAARFARGLVLFPAVAKAGKSTLAVDLARSGVRLFQDDVVPIDTRSREALALGMAPRLRPPLPPDVGSAFRAYVEGHSGPGHRNRLYVDVGAERLAPLGETAPIASVVLLGREAGRTPALVPLDPADALEEIILQNFAREVPTPLVLDTLHAVVSGATCMRLAYATTPQATRLLLEGFGDG